MEEGDTSKIRTITFTGDKVFSDSTLRSPIAIWAMLCLLTQLHMLANTSVVTSINYSDDICQD